MCDLPASGAERMPTERRCEFGDGLGTRERDEAEKLVGQLNEILATEISGRQLQKRKPRRCSMRKS